MLNTFVSGTRRSNGGLSLFGSVLALFVLAGLVLGVTTALEDWRRDGRMRTAAAQLVALNLAVRDYAAEEFTNALAAVTDGPAAIALSDLRAGGFLQPGFPDSDALGRPFEVRLVAAGASAFDTVVTTSLPANDGYDVAAAVLGQSGSSALGYVAPEAPTRLTGPFIDSDVGGYQSALSGLPVAGTLAAIERHDFNGVYGDLLYRTAVPGFAEANRMKATLDMGGNDIDNLGSLTATGLMVNEDLSVVGNMTVSAELLVGTMIDSAGVISLDEVTATTANVSGTVTADRADIATRVNADSVSAGNVWGDWMITDEITTGSTYSSAILAFELDANAIRAANLSAGQIEAGQVVATGGIDADEAGISSLTVGSCSGC